MGKGDVIELVGKKGQADVVVEPAQEIGIDAETLAIRPGGFGHWVVEALEADG